MPKEIRIGRQQIYDTLRDEIVGKLLNGGERLSEAELSARFGVSRTPIREVLRQLEQDGFATLTPNAGVRVAKIGIETALEHFQLAAALESLAVQATMEKGLDEQQFVALAGMTRKMETAIADGDFQLYEQMNNSFHNFFIEQLGNPVILSVLRDARRKMFIPFENFHTTEEIHAYIGHHDEIVALIRRGDIPEAGYAMQRHVLAVAHDLTHRHRNGTHVERVKYEPAAEK